MITSALVGARLRLALLAVLTVCAAVLGTREGRRVRSPVVATEVVLAPVPQPAGLIAEAVLPSPDATWRKAQQVIGGVVVLAPSTFGGLLAQAAHVPDLVTLIDGAASAFGVVDKDKHWVVAARAQSVPAARSRLGAVAERVEDIELFGSNVALAGGWLLVGSDRATLLALGPYAHRTLPTRELAHAMLTLRVADGALGGTVRDELERRTSEFKTFLLTKDDEQRRAHGGRAPDLADPKPVVEVVDALVRRTLDIVTALKSVEVALDVDDDGIAARVTLAPDEGPAKAWIDSLEGGGTAPLGGSSDDALATLFWRSDMLAREEAAAWLGDLLSRALGARLPTADVAKLSELLARSARARAGWAMLSVSTGPTAGVLARLAASDAAACNGVLEEAIDVARRPGWSVWERNALGVTKIERANGRVTFHTDETTVQAAWATQNGELDVAGGLDAASVLATATPARPLSGDAKTSAWLRSIGGDAVWVLVGRPLMLNSSPRSDAALIALIGGHKRAELRAHVTGPIVRQLVVSR
jgi:hypothetical protein